MIEYKKSTTDEELKQILLLQQANMPKQLSVKEIQTQGFVTVQHDMEILKKMNTITPHIIAKNNNKVIGFAICMHPKFKDEIAVLKPMFQQIEGVFSKEINYMVMGQICIDKDYRKQGVFRALYKTMKKEIQPFFSTIITGVDAINTRSLEAHYAIGFQSLLSFESEGHQWEIIFLN